MKQKLFFIVAIIFISSFAFAQTYTEIFDGGWGQGMAASRPTCTDIDHDGLLDLFIGDYKGNLFHYEQEAMDSPDFSYITNNFPDVGYSIAPCFADIDNNGLLDMLIGESKGQIIHYQQDAPDSRTFNVISYQFNDIDVGNSAKPCFTNLDNDGLLDLVIGESGGNLHYYEQDASGSTTFSLVSDSLSGIDVGSDAHPCFIDVDNDGLLDMIVGNTNGDLYHYEQDNPGSLNFILLTQNFIEKTAVSSYAPCFIDFDHDGLLDMLIGEWDGYLKYYKQNAINSEIFTLVSDNFINIIDVGVDSRPCFADLDNDGLLDMLVGEELGYLNHYEQEAPGASHFNFISNHFNNIDVGGDSKPCIIDIDGNGLLDLIIGEHDGNLNHYEQNESGSEVFNLISDTLSGIVVGKMSAPCFIDLDHDGLLDLIIGEEDGNLNHYEQSESGSTTFQLISDSLSGIVVENWSLPAFTDLDDDGLLDLIIGEYSSDLNHYEQDASDPTKFIKLSEKFNNIRIMIPSPVFFDINGDGFDDLIIGDWYGGIHYFQRDKDTPVENTTINIKPASFILFQNYPNPFNPSTQISYNLPGSTRVSLKIYNIQGQEIRTLVNEFQSAGIKSVVWDGLDEQGTKASSGIYMYFLVAGKFSSAKKMLLIQ